MYLITNSCNLHDSCSLDKYKEARFYCSKYCLLVTCIEFSIFRFFFNWFFTRRMALGIPVHAIPGLGKISLGACFKNYIKF